MVKKVRVAEAKAHLSALMARAGYVGERYLIERRGDPLAAPVGVEDLERLEALSNLMKRAPANALVTGLAHVPPEDQSTSSVTLGELLYGVHRSSHTAALLKRIEGTLMPELPILPFDAAAARRYGELRAELERRGTPICDTDTRVAAIALSRKRTAVTGNERYFRQVPELEIENWLKDQGPQGDYA